MKWNDDETYLRAWSHFEQQILCRHKGGGSPTREEKTWLCHNVYGDYDDFGGDCGDGGDNYDSADDVGNGKEEEEYDGDEEGLWNGNLATIQMVRETRMYASRM